MRHLLPATLLVSLVLLSLTTTTIVGAQQQDAEITVYPALAVDRTVSLSATRGKTTTELGVKKLIAKGTVALYNGASPAAVGHKLLVTDLSADVTDSVNDVDVDAFLGLSSLGHLFIVPDTTLQLSATGAELLNQLEGKIVTEKSDAVAVYFTKKSDRQVTELLKQVESSGAFDESVAVFSAKEQVKLEGPEVVPSVVAKLKAPKTAGTAGSKGGVVPTTLLIAVSPDTMGAAPGLAAGGSSSGLAVFMELLRVFNQLYASGSHSATKGLNLIFLLGRQGRLSYPGTADWLEHQDNSLLDQLDFSLCLDDVSTAGADDKLYLHTTKAGNKDADLKALHSSLIAAISNDAQLVAKKINASHHEMRWEHEVFSYRNVNAATISNSKVQRLQLGRSAVVGPAPTKASSEQLTALALKVSNWILSRSSTKEEKPLTTADLNVAHLASWLESGSKVARPGAVTGPTSTTGVPQYSSDFLQVGVKEAMSKLITVDKSVGSVTASYKKSSNKGTAKKDLGITFYGPLSMTMTLHTTKSTIFEATLLVGALGCIFLATAVVFGPLKAFAIAGFGDKS